MEDWKLFEFECAKYLQSKHDNDNLIFNVSGGSNSNTSDIQVIKNKTCGISIECKMSNAQCGQFVLFVDNTNKKFVYSTKNKTPFDDATKFVVSEMDRNFEDCCVSSSKNLPISNNVIIQWVKNYYLNIKKSKYGITKSNNEFIVFPISKIDKYFNFSSQYRVKKSGSSRPSKKNVDEITTLLTSLNNNTHIYFINKDCFCKLNYSQDEFILSGEKYRYKFLKEGEQYRIRRLSNTKNANFIVTIKLKRFEQDLDDLKEFENDLMKL